MNINEFINQIPEELHGSICHSSDRITFTPTKGKAVTFLFGAENSYKDSQGNVVKAKELVDYDEKLLEGIELKEVEPMERVEVVEEVTLAKKVEALEAKLTALETKVDNAASIEAIK